MTLTASPVCNTLEELTDYVQNLLPPQQVRINPKEKTILNALRPQLTPWVWDTLLSAYHLGMGELPRFTVPQGSISHVIPKLGTLPMRLQEVERGEILIPVINFEHVCISSLAHWHNVSVQEGVRHNTVKVINKIQGDCDAALMQLFQSAAADNTQLSCRVFTLIPALKMAEAYLEKYSKGLGNIVVSTRMARTLYGHQEDASQKHYAQRLFQGEYPIKLLYQTYEDIPRSQNCIGTWGEAKIYQVPQLNKTPGTLYAVTVPSELGMAPVRMPLTVLPTQDTNALQVGIAAFMEVGLGIWDSQSAIQIEVDMQA